MTWPPPPPPPPTPPLTPEPRHGGPAGRGGLLGLAVAAVIGGVAGGGVVAVLDGDPGPRGTTTVVQTFAPQVQSVTTPAPDRVAEVAAAVLPSVVSVDLDRFGSFARANGSGVVFRSDGYIVTNHHVIVGADQVEVVFADRRRLPARVIGMDERSDLAVLHVDAEGLVALQPAPSEEVRVGQLAIAVGAPFGLDSSVTAGVVSAVNRPIDLRTPDGIAVRMPAVVQTDAEINPGNSGGPLVDAHGRLVGINSAILVRGTASNAGIGFAIPAELVVSVADELIAKGFVQHAYLGVQGTSLDPDAAVRLGAEVGAYLEAVEAGTPAAEAGLREGDVIVAAGDMVVETMDDLILAIRRSAVGDVLDITYIRDGERHRATVTLTELPD